MPSDTKTADSTLDERIAAAFASPPSGGALVPMPSTGIAITDAVITAQKVAVERDEGKVLRRIRVMASEVGEDWFYRYPVKNKSGTDWIEGPSIKCANNVARMYGNCQVDTRVQDNGDSWIIYARFVDYETGFSYTRPFQQRKGQASIKSSDGGRQLDIALQIGVSKAIRNVICNALETFTNFAFEQAKGSIVKKVGENLDRYRERVIERLEALNVETIRVETTVGRAAKDWLAPDVARIITQLQAINDGMATIDDTWPPLDPSASRPTRDQFQENAKTEGEPQPEPFSVVSFNGEVAEHQTAAAAAEAFTQALDEGEKQQSEAGLTTVWDNNQGLMQALDERGEPDLSRELGLEYGRRRQDAANKATAAEAMRVQTAKAEADAFETARAETARNIATEKAKHEAAAKAAAAEPKPAPTEPVRDESWWRQETLIIEEANVKDFMATMFRRIREAKRSVEITCLRDHNGDVIDGMGKANKEQVLSWLMDRERALEAKEAEQAAS